MTKDKILQRVGIAGIGACQPSRVLTNDELEKMVDTSDEWIQQRTGIKQRYVLGPEENNSDISTKAAKLALERAALDPKELDLILLGTVTGDHIFPATSALVQQKIGAVNAAGYDISAACSGFVQALSTGSQFIATGMYKNVLVIGAEALSRITDYQDRATCVLFGDGAGAAVLTQYARAKQGEILHTTLGLDGSLFELIWMPGGGTKNPISQKVVQERSHFIQLRGREVFRFAVSIMVKLIEQELADYGKEELGIIIPHQVNLRIIEAAADRLRLPLDKFFINIDRYGNTSAASIPMALEEAWRAGKLEKGKLVVFAAFGAGTTWGSALIRW